MDIGSLSNFLDLLLHHVLKGRVILLNHMPFFPDDFFPVDLESDHSCDQNTDYEPAIDRPR